MKFKSLVFLLVIIHLSLKGQNYNSTGLIFDDKRYEETPRISSNLNFSKRNVPYYSLRQYTPTPGNQGNIGSCVGWSTAYGALTIADAIRKKESDRNVITEKARSAMYLYLQIANCPGGIRINDALEKAKEKGVPLFKDFGNVGCNTITSAVDHLASSFKIKDFYTLFSSDTSSLEQRIVATRESISSDKPVIIGMLSRPSLHRVGSEGMYRPSEIEPITGGHAVVVVGYDDRTRTFEIMNSWGTKWGNEGFFRMSYDDYARDVKYGYQFTLEDNTPVGQEVSLKGNFNLLKLDNSKWMVKFENGKYTIPKVELDDYFRIKAFGITKDKYVYIFSIKPDGTSELLFPAPGISVDNGSFGVTRKTIPVVPSSDVSIEIPIDKKEAFVTDMIGKDMLCILYSSELINDIDTVVQKMRDGSGDWLSRLKKSLGNRLMPLTDITYNSDEMGMVAKSKNGTIAPIILEINVTTKN